MHIRELNVLIVYQYLSTRDNKVVIKNFRFLFLRVAVDGDLIICVFLLNSKRESYVMYLCMRKFSFFSNPYSEYLLVILFYIASYYEKQTSTKITKT